MMPMIVHRSKSHGALLDRLAIIARSSAEVLISGPSGVGKELYATFIHSRSPRASKPFAVVNCANLSAEMIENEIFGHARGAFTGAVTSVNGIAAAAEGGTLFLDEIDTLPLPCQAKLLRFAQLREYRRLGEAYTRRCDVRLITASNVDLLERVRAGAFREDLYFRLRVVPVSIPPLVERPEDIPALIDHFAGFYVREYGVPPLEISDAARNRMLAYEWPGNVRELENCVRYLACLMLGRPVLPEDLPLLAPERRPAPALEASSVSATSAALAPPADDDDDDLRSLSEVPLKAAKSLVVEGFERMYIDTVLRNSHGNVAEAARRSGKHRRAFFQLMRRYGMGAELYRR